MKKKIAILAMVLGALTFLFVLSFNRAEDLKDQRSARDFAALSDHLRLTAQAKAEELETRAPAAPGKAAVKSVVGTGPVRPAPDYPETEDPVLLSYREMALAQPDLAGWIHIEGTDIDYPVMRCAEEADRYLHRDYEGRDSRAGTPFMMPVSDPSVPNENIIVYGHHMKSGAMFAPLTKYETQEGFLDQPLIQFDTLYERGTYQIISVFRMSVDSEKAFPYYEYEWLDDEYTFNKYIRGVTAHRLYDTGETAVYGDQLLTLSTCDYHESNGRLVVVAKKIQEKEDDTDA